MSFKPTLAVNADFTKIQYPVYAKEHDMSMLLGDASVKIAAQRKVLEQALEVIKYIGYVPRADGSHPVEKAITAIQEQLA